MSGKQLVGRHLEIASGFAGLPLETVEKYRARWLADGFDLPELDWSTLPAPRPRSSPGALRNSREKVGTQLGSLFADFLHLGGINCAKCKRLAAQLNEWGASGCEQNREAIVGHLYGNREVLIKAVSATPMVQAFLGWCSGTLLGELVLKRAAHWFLTRAIEDATAELAAQKVHRSGRRAYSGWKSEQDGPRLYLGPFASNVRHLTYHVWPTLKRHSWQWNLQQLAVRWSLFNGQRILGIVTDASTVPVSEVINYAASLGMQFDHVVSKANKPKLREVVTWREMLSLLEPETAPADHVVFSAHAKGVQYDNQSYTRNWTDLMYQSCLDYWPLVENNLRDSLMCGSFRQYGLLGKWHNWAYSGTFFWWRLREIGQRKWWDVDQWFAGTESWPGKMCDPRETTCLFLNDNERMYEAEYWQNVVWPEWEKWQQKMRFQRAS